MKCVVTIILFTVLVMAPTKARAESADLPVAISSTGLTGYLPLSEGYRGELKVVATTGEIEKLKHDRKPETMEFTHLNYNDRGIGSAHQTALAITIGSSSVNFRFPAIYIKDIPSVGLLKGFKDVKDFKDIFGEFRSTTDAWSGPNGIYSSLSWTGFSMLPDRNIRVISVLLLTSSRENSTRIEGTQIQEGIFKPTGKPPELEKKQESLTIPSNVSGETLAR